MADTLTPEQRSALMSRIRGKNTKPELAVRRALHALGYRYRIHVAGLPGRPDLVFRKRRCAVFVHGCFWHRHGCPKTTTPKSRLDYWAPKFAANVERDRRSEARLEEDGWRVFIAWECEVAKDETLMARLTAFLGPPRAAEAERDGWAAQQEGPKLPS
jgi:DNA mismatch endonuclease (patch repair protein)